MISALCARLSSCKQGPPSGPVDELSEVTTWRNQQSYPPRSGKKRAPSSSTTRRERTRALDALAARRRRLPMVQFGDSYTFDTPTGRKSLGDLFEGREQLAIYQFIHRDTHGAKAHELAGN